MPIAQRPTGHMPGVKLSLTGTGSAHPFHPGAKLLISHPLLHMLRPPCIQILPVVRGDARTTCSKRFPMRKGSDACALRC